MSHTLRFSKQQYRSFSTILASRLRAAADTKSGGTRVFRERDEASTAQAFDDFANKKNVQLSAQHLQKLNKWRENRKQYLKSDEYEQAHEGPELATPAGRDAAASAQPAPDQSNKLPRIRARVRELEFWSPLSVRALAEKLGVDPHKLVRFLPEGYTIDSKVCMDTIENLCLELNVVPVNKNSTADDDLRPFSGKDDPKKTPQRQPVVVIMGHVDHGKTTLLDKLRNTNVADKEAGRITQHIGAFEVSVPGTGAGIDSVTFIDTPGHEAFVAMRAAGAQVTDIAIIVVAADDGVQPQTIEAIHHAKSSGVPIVVALNKIDKHNANVDRTLQQLLQHDIQAEELGGNIPCVQISALKGDNLDKLLEEVVLQSEMLDLCAMRKGCRAEATVIESRVDKGMGIACTVIMRRGTLKPGSWVLAGMTYGRVRAIKDDKERQVKETVPGKPVEIFGLESMPSVGDVLIEVANEDEAKRIVEQRIQRKNIEKEDEYVRRYEAEMIELVKRKNAIRETLLKEMQPDTIFGGMDEAERAKLEKQSQEQIEKKIADELSKDAKSVLPIIFKADVQGTIDAFHEIISNFPKDEVSVQIIRQGVGTVSEADIDHARALGAHIVVMNLKPSAKLIQSANHHKVPLHTFKVIYHLIDYLKQELTKRLPIVKEEVVSGEARVKEMFEYNDAKSTNKKIVKIAGCEVTKGALSTQADFYRVMRWKAIILDKLPLQSLFHFKDKVKKIEKGKECGVVLDGYEDIKKDDIIQAIEVKEVQRSFDDILAAHRQQQQGAKTQQRLQSIYEKKGKTMYEV